MNLNDIAAEHRTALLARGRSRKIARGEAVYTADDTADTVWFVVTGRVKIVRTNVSGSESIVGIRAQGDVFGELTWMQAPSVRATSAVAIEICEVSAVPADEFQRMLHADAELARAFARGVAKRLAAAEYELTELAGKSVPGRLVDVLGRLASEHGVLDADGTMRIGLNLTHKDLADLIGTSRETLTRELSVLADVGLLRVSHRTITLLQPRAFPFAQKGAYGMIAAAVAAAAFRIAQVNTPEPLATPRYAPGPKRVAPPKHRAPFVLPTADPHRVALAVNVVPKAVEPLAAFVVTLTTVNPAKLATILHFPSSDLYTIEIRKGTTTLFSTAYQHAAVPVARNVPAPAGRATLANVTFEGLTNERRALAPGAYVLRTSFYAFAPPAVTETPVRILGATPLAAVAKAKDGAEIAVIGEPAVTRDGRPGLTDGTTTIALSRNLGLVARGPHVVRGFVVVSRDRGTYLDIARIAPTADNTAPLPTPTPTATPVPSPTPSPSSPPTRNPSPVPRLTPTP